MSVTVAVGVFDGLHLGHRAIFERALARAAGDRCVALSFDPHPDVVLAKEFRSLAPLTPLVEKRERLATIGVELEVLPFTRELAALSPEEFVERHLIEPFAPRWMVVGEDFALGRGRAGNVPRLREIGAGQGFEIEAVPLVHVDGAPVTSTRIRAALGAGRVLEVVTLLGRHYNLAGTVVGGEQIGRTLGFPTANLRLHEEKLVPANGIYVTRVRIEGEAEWRGGAMSIGVRPTFGGQARTLEVHLLDWSGDLYGRGLEVDFLDWLRSEERFESADALVAAMRRDIESARAVLAARPRA